MNQSEWRHHLQFVCSSMIANAVLFAIFGRYFLKITAPPYSGTLLWLGLGLQLIAIFLLRAYRKRRFNNQHFDGVGTITGSFIGLIIAVIYSRGVGELQVVSYMIFLGLHPAFQALMWNEVTLKGGAQKKRFRIILIAIVIQCLLYAVSDASTAVFIKDLAVLGLSLCLFVFINGWTSSRQQIWLAYAEQTKEKAGHVITKDVKSFRHLASSMDSSTRSANWSSIILMGGVVAVASILIGLIQLIQFQYHQGTAVTVLINAIAFVVQKPMAWIYQLFEPLKTRAGVGFTLGKFIPDWHVFSATGMANKMNVNASNAADFKHIQEVVAMLNQVISIGIVIVTLAAAILLTRWQMKKAKPKVSWMIESSIAVHEARNVFKDILSVVLPRGKSSQEPIDPFRKKYQRVLEKAKFKGVVIKPMDTPERIAEKLIHRLPEEREAVELFTRVYNELRYSNERPVEYERALQVLQDFTKKINALSNH